MKLKKEKKKRKKKTSTVFLLFCVSVGSFCDELTVVFCSFVCSFSTNSYAFNGVKGMLGYVSFPWLIRNRHGQGEKNPAPNGRRNKRTICTMGKGENEKKKLKTDFFFYHFLYMLVPENTDIYGKWFFT